MGNVQIGIVLLILLIFFLLPFRCYPYNCQINFQSPFNCRFSTFHTALRKQQIKNTASYQGNKMQHTLEILNLTTSLALSFRLFFSF